MRSKPRLTESVMEGLRDLRDVGRAAAEKWAEDDWDAEEQERIERASSWITAMWRWRESQRRRKGLGR